MPVPTGRTVVLASIAMICGLQNAAAAEYPERPVTVIVPYAAGGAGDTIIRSDNGPEFVAKAVQDWITAVGAKTAYITPGSPLGERLRRELQRALAR